MNASQSQAKPNESYWDKAESSRFAILPMTLTVQSCAGSVAVRYLLELEPDVHLLPLAIVAATTMGANAAGIAQMSMKWIIGGFAVSLAASLFATLFALSMA